MRSYFLFVFSWIAFSSPLFSSGINLHMLMADHALDRLQHKDLQILLQTEQDAYRNGAIFPDTGYMLGANYGEFSHWSSFFNPYIKYILQKCSIQQFRTDRDCQKLFAHFLGTLAHAIGDVNFDRYFVTEVAKREFSGDISKAQDYTDYWLDYIAMMEIPKAKEYPKKFVPLDDLINVYSEANYPVNREEVRKNTSIQYWINVVAMRRFAHIFWNRGIQMAPWAARHYYLAKGGVVDTAQLISGIWDKVWQKISMEDTIPVFYEKGRWPNKEFGIE